ncbi:retrovirus-related Pol polyprotein from transposon TNT 1-94 [Trichonephila clavipes]|nr:retrovirus-related Pol polyprotein from transposon TNT 1-94 [Trichonephila clavipes]
MLGRRIVAHQPPSTCLLELRRALLDEWCNIPEDQIDNLILSMPRRCIGTDRDMGVLETDLVILNHGQLTRTTPERTPRSPNFHTTFDRFSVHRPTTLRVFSGTSLELFFMNSVASTLNRVTDMEFNNQISVLTPNNWNTWKHDMQVLLMHYGCWQFIIQTKPEQPDEEATYKEKLDLQLRKDRCYTLIYTNISSDLKNLITETTDGVAAWKILKDHFEPVTKARVIQLLDQFFGTKYQPGEEVVIFISRVKTAATRLQEAGHKLDDLYIGFQLIRWLPQEFQSTVQQIYRWKEEDFRVVKIEAELILEANRLQLMKQDLEKAENAYLSSFTLKKSKTLPGATAAAHGNPNGKNDYQKKSGKVFNCKTIKNVKQSIKTIGPCYVCNKYGHLKVNCKEKKSLQKSPPTVNETFNTEFDKGVWVIDTAATSHFCNDKSLFLDLKPITNMKMSLATEDKSCPVEGIGTLRFRKRAERFLSKKVIAVRTDGGLEFCNKDMDNFLTELGIKHEVTNSYTPEMNGVAERFNLTALDGIKTLLKSSEVPHKFWGEALLCFTYAWNRICHKDSNKTPFEKYSGRKPSVLHLKPFGCLAYAGVPKQIRKKFDMREKIGIMMGYAQRTKGYRIWLIDENKLVETINVRFDENKRGINFRQKVNSNLGYNLNLPDYYDDEDDSDRVKDSLTSRLVSKTSTETPSTSEYPDVSSDNHSLIPCTEVKWIRNIGRKVTGSNVYYSIEGEATRLKSFNEIEILYCNLLKQPTGYEIDNNKVYDMIIFGKEMENVNFVLQLLQKNFDLKIMGKTKKLLGIEFEEIGNSLFIHQRSYIRRLCEIYEKYKYPVSSLPISKGQVLSKLDSPKTSEEILTVPYRNLIGSLSFIAIRTRPDIMYAVNVLSQFQTNPE